VLAGTLALLLFASSAPSPLYVVYQRQWGFSEITLTSVFAVYAIALLGSLLVAGSLSDHIGRRPVLLAGLGLMVLASASCIFAETLPQLIAARFLQALGGATGMVVSRAIIRDLYPRERVGHVWLVDPPLQTLEVLRLDGAGYRIVGAWRADAVVQCEPFEALSIRLADLWSA